MSLLCSAYRRTGHIRNDGLLERGAGADRLPHGGEPPLARPRARATPAPAPPPGGRRALPRGLGHRRLPDPRLRRARGLRTAARDHPRPAHPRAAAGGDPRPRRPAGPRPGRPRDDCAFLREEIDRAFAAREARAKVGAPATATTRSSIRRATTCRPVGNRGSEAGGGALDSRERRHLGRRLAPADVRHARDLRRTGLRRLARDYLGEPPAVSMQKCTLRKAGARTWATAMPGWHQDGAFLGDVRALNVWLSLSHCGDDAPGPRPGAAPPRPHRADRHRGRRFRLGGLAADGRGGRRRPADPAGRSSSPAT